MTTDSQPSIDPSPVGRGGGNATAAGVNFQASLGAVFAAQALAERGIDERLRLEGARISTIRFETEAPVDDILIETETSGWIFIQAKTALSLSESLDSELGKTAEQIVRLWHACTSGDGKRGWDRRLDKAQDRIVIAVGPAASNTVSVHLAAALASQRAPAAAPLPQAHNQALERFRALLAAGWRKIVGVVVGPTDINGILPYVAILQVDAAGPDRTAAVEVLAHVLEDPSVAPGAFATLVAECEKLMAARQGTDAADLRRTLANAGLRLRTAPSYRSDVTELRKYSDRVHGRLSDSEETKVGDVEINVERECTSAVVAAAKMGSLVLVGEPGAGKSAVLNAAARRLRDGGKEVLELAVDRLLVDSLDGLRAELNLAHALREVLENWPGAGTAFLFIDALDATRGGRSEAVFRALIDEVVTLPDARWRVIASIRTFDLRLGTMFGELFSGAPPSKRYADPAFGKVRHIHVPRWTDDELETLLARAPALATAIEASGGRLRELALVPFNTRLLADLITDGLHPDAFGQVSSQVQLLALYWQRRVLRHGVGAELCLRAAVDEMVASQALQALRLETARSDPTAFEDLMRSSVLVLVGGDRYVAFRHHILFDYAASRVFINPADIPSTAHLLSRDGGLGFMLAPALAFALQDLWVNGEDDHGQFWRTVIHIAGSSDADPISRTVAARSACELPCSASDLRGLLALLAGTAERNVASSAFTHIVGALVVRIEDRQQTEFGPWCYLAAEASAHVATLVWPLRTLIYLLVGRAQGPEQLGLIGHASRVVLDYALNQGTLPSQLTAGAIGFVADTYATNPTASRDLLRRLMTPERMKEHAHEDMVWMARKIAPICATDPTFAVEIYRAVFAHDVTDTDRTSIWGSRILPLVSNRRQDYEMARFSLKEAFPGFLRASSIEAIRAMIAAIEGYVAAKHPISERVQEVTIRVEADAVKLLEDMSHIWAWNSDDVHADNAVGLVNAFSAWLATAPPEDAAQAVAEVSQHNRLALIWARLFLIGAKRHEVVGKLLWRYATQTPFLMAADTRKDARDLIAVRYPFEEEPKRAEFERQVLGVDFPQTTDPNRARQSFRLSVLGPIDENQLVTAEAKRVLEDAPEAERQRSGRRSFEVLTTIGEPERFWWLKRAGIDVNASPNAEILEQTDELAGAFGLAGRGEKKIDLAAGIAALRALLSAANAAAHDGAAPDVIQHVTLTIAQGCERLSRERDILRQEAVYLDALCSLVEPLLLHSSPKVAADAEARHEAAATSSGGVRVEAVEAALNLCNIDTQTAHRLLARVRRLIHDPHPDVRLALAHRLVALWDTDREEMWRLASECGQHEPNRRVLRFLSDSLMRLVHADPARVESCILAILPRASAVRDKPAEELLEIIGSLIALLWVSHMRSAAYDTLQMWLVDPAVHESELGHALFSIREGLVLGYETDEERDAAIRQRCQEFAARVVDVTATGMERYFSLPSAQQTGDENRKAGSLARLLDHAGNQLFLASGAFKNRDDEKAVLDEDVLKRAFLDDNYATFHRIGDVGTPHTIHQLMELLAFLLPASPERVFDLVAHALLTSGRQQSYQFESLGADRFVEVVGRLLADHRALFRDEQRRRKLVACLDAFVDAGWPAARRLIYRLPELLQ